MDQQVMKKQEEIQRQDELNRQEEQRGVSLRDQSTLEEQKTDAASLQSTMAAQELTKGLPELPAEPVVTTAPPEPVLTRKQRRKQAREIRKIHPTIADVNTLTLRRRLLAVPQEEPQDAEAKQQSARAELQKLLTEMDTLSPGRFAKDTFLANIEAMTAQYRKYKNYQQMLNDAGDFDMQAKSLLPEGKCACFVAMYEAACYRFGINADGIGLSEKVTKEQAEMNYSKNVSEANKLIMQQMAQSMNLPVENETQYHHLDAKIMSDFIEGRNANEMGVQPFAEWKTANPQKYRNYIVYKRLQSQGVRSYFVTGGGEIREPLFRNFLVKGQYNAMSLSEDEYVQWGLDLSATEETEGSVELAREKNLAGLKTMKKVMLGHYSFLAEKYGDCFERPDGLSIDEIAARIVEIRRELNVNSQVDNNLQANMSPMWEDTEEDNLLKDLIVYYHTLTTVFILTGTLNVPEVNMQSYSDFSNELVKNMAKFPDAVAAKKRLQERGAI